MSWECLVRLCPCLGSFFAAKFSALSLQPLLPLSHQWLIWSRIVFCMCTRLIRSHLAILLVASYILAVKRRSRVQGNSLTVEELRDRNGWDLWCGWFCRKRLAEKKRRRTEAKAIGLESSRMGSAAPASMVGWVVEVLQLGPECSKKTSSIEELNVSSMKELRRWKTQNCKSEAGRQASLPEPSLLENSLDARSLQDN